MKLTNTVWWRVSLLGPTGCITFHRLRNVSLAKFLKDMQSSVMLSSTDGTTDSIVEAYNSSSKAVLETPQPPPPTTTTVTTTTCTSPEKAHILESKCSLIHRGDQRGNVCGNESSWQATVSCAGISGVMMVVYWQYRKGATTQTT